MTAKNPLAKAEKAGKTNTLEKSLVKVVVIEDRGKWVKPEKASTHYIDENAELPDVTFEIETEVSCPFAWKWKLVWEAKVSGVRESAKRGSLLKKFEESGSISRDEKTWKVNFGGKVLGGVLTVEVEAGEDTFKRSIYIKGKNPSGEKIKAFVDTLDGAKGYDKILMHEALGKNFINADGEPVVSFDKGYGISQMTNPAPSYEQCWSWKENIKGGKSIYANKRADAKSHLGKKGKDSYTEEQLQTETYSLYNGGYYYEWDATKKAWVPRDFLCDSSVANIGWIPDVEVNKDKTAEELHERDKDTFKKGKKGQSATNAWIYTGVCYANVVNEK